VRSMATRRPGCGRARAAAARGQGRAGSGALLTRHTRAARSENNMRLTRAELGTYQERTQLQLGVISGQRRPVDVQTDL